MEVTAMKTNSSTLISRAANLLAIGLIILLLAAVTAGTALACHKGKPHGKDAPDACGPPVSEAPDNMVAWGIDPVNSGLFEDIPRLCSLSQVAPDFSSGTYDCVLNTTKVHYNYQEMPCLPVHRRGDDWRCAEHGEWMHASPNLEYSFGWAGDCTSSEGCTVTIVNRFVMMGSTSGLVGRLTMEAFTDGVQSTAKNPFFAALDLEIDYILVTKFDPKARNKVVAICELTPIPLMPVTFHTNPVADPQ
jgi:hypothetical protein